MTQQTKQQTLFAILLFLFCRGAALAQNAAPQTAPPSAWQTKDIHFHAQKLSLTQAMRLFAEQTGSSYFIDGEPLQKEADFDFDLKAKDALDKIADAFDYLWTVSRRGTILLNKRFKNPDELPQMPYREMRRMASDLFSLWPTPASPVHSQLYPFDHRSIRAGNGLYQALTADQIAYLQTGQFLTYDQLSPDQQHIVDLSVRNQFTETTGDAWEILKICLDNLPRSTLQFRLWRSRADIPGSDDFPEGWGSLDCVWDKPAPYTLTYFHAATQPTEKAQFEASVKAAEKYLREHPLPKEESDVPPRPPK